MLSEEKSGLFNQLTSCIDDLCSTKSIFGVSNQLMIQHRPIKKLFLVSFYSGRKWQCWRWYAHIMSYDCPFMKVHMWFWVPDSESSLYDLFALEKSIVTYL